VGQEKADGAATANDFLQFHFDSLFCLLAPLN